MSVFRRGFAPHNNYSLLITHYSLPFSQSAHFSPQDLQPPRKRFTRKNTAAAIKIIIIMF